MVKTCPNMAFGANVSPVTDWGHVCHRKALRGYLLGTWFYAWDMFFPYLWSLWCFLSDSDAESPSHVLPFVSG